MADEARILCEIPLATGAGTGTRIIAGQGDLFHIFHRKHADADRLAPQQTFNPAGATDLAHRVLAGDPKAMTAPETLRILAAAVILAARDRAIETTASARLETSEKREEAGRAD